MQQGTEDYPEPQHSQTSQTQESQDKMTKIQQRKILTILFGRLLKMHKNIMITATIVHAIIIALACLHIFTLGTIESEKNSCYLTWPLTHLYYAFINYLFAWFFSYNACEINNPKGQNVLIVSKKFLKVIFFFSFTPIPVKFLSAQFCRNWSLSWNAVGFQTAHILIESIICFVYFNWFERKYAGFRIFYRESVFE